MIEPHVVKISGEALKAKGSDEIVGGVIVREIAEALKAMTETGIGTVVVVGGGNIARGEDLINQGIKQRPAHAVGMLSTVQNAFILEDILEQLGQPARAMTAFRMEKVAEEYIPKRAIRHLEKGRVVIVGGGIGRPNNSSDSAAAQIAVELECVKVIMAKNGVDAAYTADPHRFPDHARRIDQISCEEFVIQRLGVCDVHAIAFCQSNRLNAHIVGIDDPWNILRAAQGERIGTFIHP